MNKGLLNSIRYFLLPACKQRGFNVYPMSIASK